MLKRLVSLSILLMTGCSDSETINRDAEKTTAAGNPCHTLSNLLNDPNLQIQCDGQRITVSGPFVFSKTVHGKTMVSLAYIYTKEGQKKEDYYNGILKKTGTPPALTEGQNYTMQCTLTSALFEQCTIKPLGH